MSMRAKGAAHVWEARLFALSLGANVEKLRRKDSLSQTTLGKRVGVSQPVVSRIEAGMIRPDAFTYGKLAEAFGLTVAALDQQVNETVAATKRAAVAISRRTADEVFTLVGGSALAGLVRFAASALLAPRADGRRPKSEPQPSPLPPPRA